MLSRRVLILCDERGVMELDPEFVEGIAEVMAREGWRPRESCLPIAEKIAEHILETAVEKLKASPEPQFDPFEPKQLAGEMLGDEPMD
jgi:hypothetical protein